MKRILLIVIILTVFLTACSGPASTTATSPSSSQPVPTTESSGIVRAADYDALLKLVRQAQTNLNQYPGRSYMYRGAEATAKAADSNQSMAGGTAAYSQTNIQVEGVDEADIIKTDGRYLYIVANNRLYIVDAQNPAAMKVLANKAFKTNVETDKISTGEHPVEMYLDIENQRLTLIVNGWIYAKSALAAEDGAVTKSSVSSIRYPYYNNKQYTSTRIYDLSDKTAPKLVRQFTQEGSYVSSRKIAAAVYVVTNQYQYRIYFDQTADPKPSEIFPATSETTGDIQTIKWETIPADRISILPNGDIGNQMVLVAINTLKDGSKPDILSVVGSSGIIYASAQHLYVAAYSYLWDGKGTSAPTYSTDIYRFKLSSAEISEAGKGQVPGSIINQFSMDEYGGNFRIATTSGSIWMPTGSTAATNNVYVLDNNLKVIGKVTGLAPGETIKSVRFMGSKVYVVTFRNVDPLFVIDLANPAAPKVLGQLKIPGYSTYLHPYAENMLIGFGYDVKNEGNNAYNMGLKVSLFDVSNFSSPKELSTILLGSRGSSADILYNHKTLLFSKEKDLIAFPATLTKTITNHPLEYGQPVFQGLLILNVKDNNQMTLRGQITHFDKLSDPNGKPKTLTEDEMQAFYGYDSIIRGAYIGDVLYTVSRRQVRAAQLDNLSKLGQVELPGYEDYQKYYYGGGIAVRQGAAIAID